MTEQKIDNCQEGGEGVVINPSKKAIPLRHGFVRCSCTGCKAPDCLRKILFFQDLEEDMPSKEPVGEFCGDLQDDPVNECSHYVRG